MSINHCKFWVRARTARGAALEFTRSPLDAYGLPLHLVAFCRIVVCRHGRATSSLKVHGPYHCLRDGYEAHSLNDPLHLFHLTGIEHVKRLSIHQTVHVSLSYHSTRGLPHAQ
jgi:hypothetical protein